MNKAEKSSLAVKSKIAEIKKLEQPTKKKQKRKKVDQKVEQLFHEAGKYNHYFISKQEMNSLKTIDLGKKYYFHIQNKGARAVNYLLKEDDRHDFRMPGMYDPAGQDMYKKRFHQGLKVLNDEEKFAQMWEEFLKAYYPKRQIQLREISFHQFFMNEMLYKMELFNFPKLQELNLSKSIYVYMNRWQWYFKHINSTKNTIKISQLA